MNLQLPREKSTITLLPSNLITKPNEFIPLLFLHFKQKINDASYLTYVGIWYQFHVRWIIMFEPQHRIRLVVELLTHVGTITILECILLNVL